MYKAHQKVFDYLPRKYEYNANLELPKGTTISTCAYCGKVYYIPKGSTVVVTFCCDSEECIARYKNRDKVRRKVQRKFNRMRKGRD